MYRLIAREVLQFVFIFVFSRLVAYLKQKEVDKAVIALVVPRKKGGDSVSDNDIKVKELVEPMQGRVKHCLARVKDELGYNLRIVEAYRTPQKQEEYYTWGRTVVNPNTGQLPGLPFGRTVTNSRANTGMHGQRRAIDLVDRKLGYNIAWDKVGLIGKQCGLVWGGDWSLADNTHFEYHGTTPLASVNAPTQQEKPMSVKSFNTWGEHNEYIFQFIHLAVKTTWAEGEMLARYRELAAQGIEPTAAAQRLFIDELVQRANTPQVVADNTEYELVNGPFYIKKG